MPAGRAPAGIVIIDMGEYMSRAIMTIHGYLTDDKDFGVLYDHLEGYDCVHRCIVAGHGQDGDLAQFTVDNVITGVLADYDRLASQYDIVDVVGYSMGGCLTSYLCAVRTVHRAVMLAPSNLYFNFNAIGRWIMYMLRQMKEPLTETAGTLPDKFKATKEHLADDLADIEKALGMAGNMLSRISVTNYNTFAKLMKSCNKVLDNTYAVGGAIQTPTLIVMGGLDELVPHKSVEYVASRMCNANIVDIDNLGHSMMRSRHDGDIVDMIVAHLQQSASKAGVA